MAQATEPRTGLKPPPLVLERVFDAPRELVFQAWSTADHVKRELEAIKVEVPDLIVAGPAPAPLARAETQYRYQIMLRTHQMTRLGRRLSVLLSAMSLPEDVMLTVDVDPVSMM